MEDHEIVETHAVNHERHQEVILLLRNKPEELLSLNLNSQGWLIARFKDRLPMIAGMLPASMSWIAGLRSELVMYSTRPVEKESYEQREAPIQYQLHLRLRLTAGDPHAIGHTFHENEALLAKRAGDPRGRRPRRALARTGDRSDSTGLHDRHSDQWRSARSGSSDL